MSQADSHTTTRATADASRRRFLAITAGASAVSAGSLALAAVPAPLHQFTAADAEVVAAGAKFEAILKDWVPAWIQWAKLLRDAHEEVGAEFGEDDCDNENWTKPLCGTSPAFLYLQKVCERNGCDRASDAEFALQKQMEPLAEIIRNAEVTSLAGLRAKTIITVLDFWPTIAHHDGHFSPEHADGGFWSLFWGAASLTGLLDLVGNIGEQLSEDGDSLSGPVNVDSMSDAEFA